MFKILMKSIREYKKASILTPLFVTLEVIMECCLPLLTAELINRMEDNNIKIMIYLMIALVVLASLGLLFGFLSAKYAAEAASGFAKNLRHDLYYKIQDFSFENIDKFSASSLVTRMTTDVANVQMSYGMIIRTAVRSPLMLIFSIIMAFTLNAKIAGIILCIAPLVALSFFIVAKCAMPLFDKVFKKYDKLNESIQENINGIRVVKTYVREDYEQDKFDKAADEVCNDFTKAERIVAINSPVMNFAMNITLIIVCILGAHIILDTWGLDLNVGDLQALLTYNIQILNAIMFLNFIFVMISISMSGGKRIAEVLKEESTLKNPENPIYEINNGSIEFKNVSFKYSTKAEKFALENINLSIPSGATVGIIGGTGSAKTTLVNLISRLYDVTEGELLVAGKNVKEYDLKTLRDMVSVVLQKNVLFSGTIAENLRWGKKDATQQELEHVCHLACADEFINRFPDKYETHIDQGGTNVSGGQKQRLCIARALLKSPKILILDDSTSAVDTKTDAIIRSSFKKYLPDTTKIIIAQRISSVSDADIIIVLDGGHIDGIGSHDELLANNQIYKEVHDIQNKISSNEGGAL
ncbi:MAG: ABC transporter ATP-binding protein [Acholeplasmatales bacterium]|nr:ABC transporter ATP-binding protein [Acholeplasmatales bacterium]